MSLIKRILRYYLYSRRGLTHIGVALTFFNFINILYLISREWTVFKHLKYSHLVILTLALIVPVLIVVGYLDFKKGYFATEASMSTEQNPYFYRATPGKEKELALPLQLLSLRLMKKFYEKEGILTPEDRKRLEKLIQKTQLLIDGEKL